MLEAQNVFQRKYSAKIFLANHKFSSQVRLIRGFVLFRYLRIERLPANIKEKELAITVIPLN
jgi:hypothetical protein